MRALPLLMVLGLGCARVADEPRDLEVREANFWGSWSGGGGGGSGGGSCSGADCVVNSLTSTSDAGVRTPTFVSTAPAGEEAVHMTRAAFLCFDNTCAVRMKHHESVANLLNVTASSGVNFEGGLTVAGTLSFNQNSTGVSCNGQASGTDCVIMANGARVNFGNGSADYLSSDGTAVQAAGYFEQQMSGAGAPTGTDCDAADEQGRQYIDTTNDRLYVCNEASGRGWDYIALTD
jgi:hypothetical protein